MFGLNRKRDRTGSKYKEKENNALTEAIKDDLIGVSQWKKSKFGVFTGISVLTKGFGTISNSFNDSAERTKNLSASLLRRNTRYVEELEDPEIYNSAAARFAAAASAQNIDDAKMRSIVLNTYKGGYFYALLLTLYTLYIIALYVLYPTISYYQDISRFSLFPILFAFTFQNFYTNWCVRNRLAASPLEYIKGRSWLPQKK